MGELWCRFNFQRFAVYKHAQAPGTAMVNRRCVEIEQPVEIGEACDIGHLCKRVLAPGLSQPLMIFREPRSDALVLSLHFGFLWRRESGIQGWIMDLIELESLPPRHAVELKKIFDFGWPGEQIFHTDE